MTGIVLAGLGTAALVGGIVWWLERGESHRSWRNNPTRRAVRDAWVAAQGPRVGDWAWYVGPSMRQPDGAILLMGASVRVAKRWRELDGVEMAKVEPVVGQPWRVPVSALQDMWDREAAPDQSDFDALQIEYHGRRKELRDARRKGAA